MLIAVTLRRCRISFLTAMRTSAHFPTARFRFCSKRPAMMRKSRASEPEPQLALLPSSGRLVVCRASERSSNNSAGMRSCPLGRGHAKTMHFHVASPKDYVFLTIKKVYRLLGCVPHLYPITHILPRLAFAMSFCQRKKAATTLWLTGGISRVAHDCTGMHLYCSH
jgi:hypothetical protein